MAVHRVLIVHSGGDSTRAARELADGWLARANRRFEISDVTDGAAIMEKVPVCEDHEDNLRYDLTLLRSMCDVLIVCASSESDGMPPKSFGSFYLALMTAANATTADDGMHLAGMQHAVLGEGDASREGRTFQNVPRLTDKYLGDCGSRRLAVRVEVDASLAGGEVQRGAFAESVFDALQALPGPAQPAVCEWTASRGCTVAARADHVTPKTVEQLAAYRPNANEWGELEGLAWIGVLLTGPAIVLLCYWARSLHLAGYTLLGPAPLWPFRAD